MSGGGIGQARELLAATVTAAGILCDPYPPDTVVAPAAWVDAVKVDTTSGWGHSLAEVKVTAVGQRTDFAASLAHLEEAAETVLQALTALPGIQAGELVTGTTVINQQQLPAVSLTVQFHISQ